MIPLAPILLLMQMGQVAYPCPADRSMAQVRTKALYPSVVQKFYPELTIEARQSGISWARVLLTAVILADGSVCNVRSIFRRGFGLEDAAIESLMRWTLAPGANRQGMTALAQVSVEIDFQYEGDLGEGKPGRRSGLDRAVASLHGGDFNAQTKGLAQIAKLSRKAYAPADAYMALLHLYRAHVAQDDDRMVRLAERSAKQALSQYVLGRAYLEGRSVPKSLDRAFAYFLQAADSGLVPAMVEAGSLAYQRNDAVQGRKLYERCAALKAVECIQRLN